jgi:hypothetical protein
MDTKDFFHLLAEIRYIQREHLEEYRRVASESLELQRSAVKRQEQAVQRQEQIGRLYQRVVVVGAIMIAAGIGLILYTLGMFRR